MRLCLLLVILSTAVTTASAQSLADVARQENQRRETVTESGKSGKTYTNRDLKPVAGPSASSSPAVEPSAAGDTAGGRADASAAPDPSASSTAIAADADKASGSVSPASADGAAADSADAAVDGAAADGKGQVKDEAYWSARMAGLQERLERDQTFAEALQNRIDALTTDFVNRDDPAQRGQIAADRQKALTELERVRKAIEQDRLAIPALEEEARRAGVPAGWLR
jgi:hypothetical protein